MRISVAPDGMTPTPACRDGESWFPLDDISAADALTARDARHLRWVAARAEIAARVVVMLAGLGRYPILRSDGYAVRTTKFEPKE